jgi:hypothetical protein
VYGHIGRHRRKWVSSRNGPSEDRPETAFGVCCTTVTSRTAPRPSPGRSCDGHAALLFVDKKVLRFCSTFLLRSKNPQGRAPLDSSAGPVQERPHAELESDGRLNPAFVPLFSFFVSLCSFLLPVFLRSCLETSFVQLIGFYRSLLVHKSVCAGNKAGLGTATTSEIR